MTFDITMTVAGTILAGLILAVMLAAPVVLFILRYCLNMDHENAPDAFGTESLLKFVPKWFVMGLGKGLKVVPATTFGGYFYCVQDSRGRYYDKSDGAWELGQLSGTRHTSEEQAQKTIEKLNNKLDVIKIIGALFGLVAGGLAIDIALAAFAHSPIATISVAGTILTVFGTRYLAGKVWGLKGRMGKVENDVENIREDLNTTKEDIEGIRSPRTVVKI